MEGQLGPHYNGNMYMYDEELYDRRFPLEWAMNHKPKTGPKECKCCREYGSWRGCFIGYCANCAINEYKYERCRGFICHGIVYKGGFCDGKPSPFETYLKGVSLDKIGDIDLNPADQLDVFGRPIYRNSIDGISDMYDRVLGPVDSSDKRDPLNDAFIEEEEEITRPPPPSYMYMNQQQRLATLRRQWYENQDKDKKIKRLEKQLRTCRKLWKLERQQVNVLLKMVDEMDAEIERQKARLARI
jgi:hypothetical protein